ncbi:MAG TPA: glucose-6-phosphate dehydrogenase [Solirubrobacterales bacterium]|nr:glucose-6-phosphate dehydrogenase [Solirubrobacterales bacterium]
MEIPPHAIVIFGATGDLARRKLLPGLLRLFQAGLLPEFRVIGVARGEINDARFRAIAEGACREFARHAFGGEEWHEFSRRLTYVPFSAAPDGLRDAVRAAEEELGPEMRLLHYLSVPPTAAPQVIHMLSACGLSERSRVVMEKPFGTDLESARELNEKLHEVLDEDQIFRIDHFLGKEAAQNILALRFANGLFEPIWNRSHIDHIQIDVPETLGVGTRAAFYERTGAFRDMVVTHLMQILAFVAMEPPTALAPEPITTEKNKVFRSLKPLEPHQVVRGQYEGYRQEEGVDPESSTETFVALRCELDNWRWSGVPFYLRTGKRMEEHARIISIAFREPPHAMFPEHSRVGRYGPDHLTFDLDESSRVSLSFYGKRPGMGMVLDKASMQFSLEETGYHEEAVEAYERLIRDAMVGDHTLFTTAAGIERLWEVSEPLLRDPPPVKPYPQGSWGPSEIGALIAPHSWRLPFARRWREGSALGGDGAAERQRA